MDLLVGCHSALIMIINQILNFYDSFELLRANVDPDIETDVVRGPFESP